jgi:Raf kinase inhibitor-like YbhB/YbcL family protein
VTRGVAFAVCVLALGGCGGGGSGAGSTAGPSVRGFAFAGSSAISDGEAIPARYTCDGANTPPALAWTGIPQGTKELALVLEDPDAPSGTFTHLTRYGISSRGGGRLDTGQEGRNSAGTTGWTPPCPPKGNGTHHYVWTVYALRDPSNLKPGASPAKVTTAVKSPLASGSIAALYSR